MQIYLESYSLYGFNQEKVSRARYIAKKPPSNSREPKA